MSEDKEIILLCYRIEQNYKNLKNLIKGCFLFFIVTAVTITSTINIEWLQVPVFIVINVFVTAWFLLYFFVLLASKKQLTEALRQYESLTGSTHLRAMDLKCINRRLRIIVVLVIAAIALYIGFKYNNYLQHKQKVQEEQEQVDELRKAFPDAVKNVVPSFFEDFLYVDNVIAVGTSSMLYHEEPSQKKGYYDWQDMITVTLEVLKQFDYLNDRNKYNYLREVLSAGRYTLPSVVKDAIPGYRELCSRTGFGMDRDLRYNTLEKCQV